MEKSLYQRAKEGVRALGVAGLVGAVATGCSKPQTIVEQNSPHANGYDVVITHNPRGNVIKIGDMYDNQNLGFMYNIIGYDFNGDEEVDRISLYAFNNPKGKQLETLSIREINHILKEIKRTQRGSQ